MNQYFSFFHFSFYALTWACILQFSIHLFVLYVRISSALIDHILHTYYTVPYNIFSPQTKEIQYYTSFAFPQLTPFNI